MEISEKVNYFAKEVNSHVMQSHAQSITSEILQHLQKQEKSIAKREAELISYCTEKFITEFEKYLLFMAVMCKASICCNIIPKKVKR